MKRNYIKNIFSSSPAEPPTTKDHPLPSVGQVDSSPKHIETKRVGDNDIKDNNSSDSLKNEEESSKDGREIEENQSNEIEKMETDVANDDENKCPSESVTVLDDSDDKIEPSKEGSTASKISNLEITPKKVSSPKQIQKKLESEKKRQQRQKEKEEKDKKKQEERDRIKQEKLKKKEEKQKELEQKQKEKEQKEEQRKKEKEEKEEQKRKEREEKEQKRKEKEEKEEQKRKEREQEKLKKQQEMEEKNKEKQKEEEIKQKTAAAFVNFFVPKKSDGIQEDKKSKVTQSLAFMEFEVKSDMKLPPSRRIPLSEIEKKTLERYIEHQDESTSYIKDLKRGKQIGKSVKTWPFEEVEDNDVTIIEDESNLGETICEDKSKLQKLRAKFLKFHENRRPAYFGTWRKKSSHVKARKPFDTDKKIFNYDEDSDDDWEEEEQGESLNGSDDEADKENEDEKDDYEVDNEFFVPHGHLSEDEIDDEESARLSPESLKQKLKLLKDEFDQDMQSKTHKLKPRFIGCIWYNKDGSNVEEAIRRYLQPLAVITNGQIQIKKRDEIFIHNSGKKNKPLKELNPEYVPSFLKVIHGNANKKRVLIEQFITYMANNGFTVDVSKATLLKNLKVLATWRRCKDNGPLKNKFCWLVNEDVVRKYDVDLSLNNSEGDKK